MLIISAPRVINISFSFSSVKRIIKQTIQIKEINIEENYLAFEQILLTCYTLNAQRPVRRICILTYLLGINLLRGMYTMQEPTFFQPIYEPRKCS